MRESAISDGNENRSGWLQGVQFLTSRTDHVVAETKLIDDHLCADGAVLGGVVMALADAVVRWGALLNMPEGSRTATVDSSVNFLRVGSGDLLRAEAKPLRLGESLSTWRVHVLRGPNDVIAEVTQTQIRGDGEQTPKSGPRTKQSTTTSAVERRLSATTLAVFEGGPEKARRGDTVENRKEQIFKAACEVIAKKGFKDATIRQIAAVAGMPVPTMYQYIQNKSDLLLIVYQHFMEDIERSLGEVVGQSDDPAENLTNAIECLLRKSQEHEKYIRLMVQETRSLDADERRKVFEADARSIEMLKRVLESNRTAGLSGFDDDQVGANLIYFLCGLWPLRHWALPNHDADSISHAVAGFLLKGLGVNTSGHR